MTNNRSRIKIVILGEQFYSFFLNLYIVFFLFSVALNEELVGGWLSCNFMVPAQVSSHLSGAFDGHHRPYVVNLKLCHDLWDD